MIRIGKRSGGGKERRRPGALGARPHALKNLKLFCRNESREIAGLELRWQEILGAGASSLRAERMQNQELARPQALGGQPFSPIRRRKY